MTDTSESITKAVGELIARISGKSPGVWGDEKASALVAAACGILQSSYPTFTEFKVTTKLVAGEVQITPMNTYTASVMAGHRDTDPQWCAEHETVQTLSTKGESLATLDHPYLGVIRVTQLVTGWSCTIQPREPINHIAVNIAVLGVGGGTGDKLER